jgi:hypothetical protein
MCDEPPDGKRGGAPQSVAVDGNGVYIANGTEEVTIETPRAHGYLQSKLRLSGVNATSVAADARGNFYTVDEEHSRVIKWTPHSGSYSQRSIGTNLSYPIAVTADRNGNVSSRTKAWCSRIMRLTWSARGRQLD